MRVLNLREAAYLKLREIVLKRITVIKFGVNDGDMAMVQAVVEST